jgi:hypothetical protein
LEQPENVELKFVTLTVFQDTNGWLNNEHPANVVAKLLTLKPLKIGELNDEQLLNVFDNDTLPIFNISQLERFWLKELHPKNIPFISVQLDMSQFVIGALNNVQFRNISIVLVTADIVQPER